MDLISPLVKYFLPKALERLTRSRSNPERNVIASRVAQHLQEMIIWSGNIQFLGMPSPQSTEGMTIALGLAFGARRFQSSDIAALSEAELLDAPRSFLILGEPGSGKTTTLKRLAQRLIETPEHAEDSYQFPVVVRLRDLGVGTSTTSTEPIMVAVADALGIRYQLVEEKVWVDNERLVTVIRARVGDDLLANVIPDILSASGVLLLLDGLDEARDIRAVLNDVATLIRRLPNGKILLTCRAGEYHQQIEGLHVVTLQPLTPTHARAIAEAWLGPQAEDFINALDALPYRDVADRPLMLCQLLFLFQRVGHLPDQQGAVYRRLTNLLLHDWDAERGIQRRTMYSGFLPERKADFLAALSYHLTYRRRARAFTEADLIQAYQAIHAQFSLPEAQAREVAHELETHTGIVIEASQGLYEFSHLSLQEYLCADHMVREPEVQLLDEYARRYPAPLAVAVALSSNSTAWFTQLVLRHIAPSFSPESVSSFLKRVLLERAVFVNEPALGMAILYLMSRYDAADYPDVHRDLHEFIERHDLVLSLKQAFAWYIIEPSLTEVGDYVYFTKRMGLLDRYGVDAPSSLRIPKNLVRRLVPNEVHAVVWRKDRELLELVTGRESFLR